MSVSTRSLRLLALSSLILGSSLSGLTAEAAPIKIPTVKPTVKPKPKPKKKVIIPPKTTPSAPDAPSGDGDISPGPTCTVKTSDIIDKRIDIGAQQSLMRKMAGTWEQRREASSMIMAVKESTLDGILLPPRKAVSDRGQRMSPKKGYWELIPTNESSTCLKEPKGEPPMILYRTEMNKPQIDAALTSAWDACGLATLPKPCAFEVDLHKPEDPPLECKVDQDCIDKQIGNVCNSKNTCEVAFPGITITPGKPESKEKAKCYDQAWRTWREKKTKCEDEEFPRLAECALDHKHPVALAKCLYDSYAEKEACKRKAFDEYEHKRKHVCPKK